MKKSTLCLFLFSCFTALAQDDAQVKQLVDEATKSYRASKSSRALVVGIVYQGKQKFYTYGETTKGSGIAPSAKSIFEIGQVTEVFTTSLLADMVMQGEVSLNDPLSQFLPKDMRTPTYSQPSCKPERVPIISDILQTPLYVCEPDPEEQQYPIQLCDLATHTTGLPAMKRLKLNDKKNPYAAYSTADLYQFLNTYTLASPHLNEYQYSPLNIALIGHALSLQTGKDYDVLLQERLLNRLNLSDTRTKLTKEQLERSLPGHSQRGKRASNWTFQALAPMGALHSSAQDLVQFVAVHLGIGKDKLFYSLALTHQSRYPVSRHAQIGLGWVVTPMNGSGNKTMIESKGQTGGYSAYVGFTRSSSTGVVILSNTAQPVDEIGTKILQSLQQVPLSVQQR